MLKKTLLLSFCVLVVLTFTLPASAVTIKKLGNPGTAFWKPPLKTVADVKKMVQARRTDIAAILQQRGWSGNVDDLVNAVNTANVTETTIDPGATLPFMGYRKHGKPAYFENVTWGGRTSFPVFVVEFTSNGTTYRAYFPKPCGNFWLETVSAAAPTRPVEAVPSVRVDTAGEVCTSQVPTVRVNVSNASAGSNVRLSVDGQNVATFAATNGTTEKQLSAFSEPGSHSITATLDGATSPGAATLVVKACVPVCTITPLPATIKKGSVVSVDASGSHVASGVSGNVKSAQVDVLRDGVKVDSFTLTAPNLKKDDVKLDKPGVYTIRTTVTDDAGQTSTNTCEASIDVPKPKNPFFVGAYVGKERLVRTSDVTVTNPDGTTSTTAVAAGRCAALIGVEGGWNPEIAPKTELELAIGGKINLRDGSNSSLFGDVAIERYLSEKFFVGGGVSFWDLTISDTRTVALLAETGTNLDDAGRYQLVFEGRIPFDQFDDVKNNYQFWGGIRFRWGR
ncbi:MAG TPA: hypothetical protein VFG11_11020 [Acidobacteriota bacterium]|nr:hypothetical protein [Acidobacteriota bacterium]